MSRYTKTQVTQLSANEQAAINNINKNFDDIETAIKDTVSRSGNTPTHMTEDLDMNGKRIINLPAPKTDTDPVRRQDVVGDIALVQSLVNATTNAAAQTLQAAAEVQEIMQDENVGLVADDLALDENSKIRICGANISNITSVANNESNITSVASNSTNINAVASNATNINKVATYTSAVETVSDNIEYVRTVGTNILDVSAVSNNIQSISNVEDNEVNINKVANNISNVNTVAGISSDISTVADDTTNIDTVSTNIPGVNTCATNMAAILDAPNQATSAKQYAIGLPTEPQEGSAKHWANIAMTETQLKPGMLVPFAGNTAPAGWLICDGSAISRTTYSDLFDVIGTTYGSGDGSTTFNLPDLTYRQVGSTIGVMGNGLTLGLTDGTNLFGMAQQLAPNAASAKMFGPSASCYGSSVGTSVSNTSAGINKASVGITTDATKSGIVADLSSAITLNMIIKY